MTTCRTSLIDPLVDPAEALRKVTPTSTRVASAGQALKSTLAKPVVVIIDAVLKKPWRTASPPLSVPVLVSATTTTAEATTSRTRYARSSSSRASAAGRRRTIPANMSAKFVPAKDHRRRDDPLRRRGERLDRPASGEKPPVATVVSACATAL
jgi:hypothetical protein